MLKYIRRRGRKGILGFFLVFIILALVCIFLFGLIIPISIKLDSEIYNAAGDILGMVNTTNENITEAVEAARASISEQIEIKAAFFKYSWLIVILIISLVLFMKARTTVESEIR